MSDLPSREQFETAISPWWSGGGRARLIIDVLRRTEANLDEARAVGERLAIRAEGGLNFFNEDNIGEALEMVRASFAVRASRVAREQRGLDTADCVFVDGLRCPNCGVVHGHPISGGTALHGAFHLGRYFAGDVTELECARWPEKCDCGFEEPPNVDVQKVIENLVSRDLVGSWDRKAAEK